MLLSDREIEAFALDGHLTPYDRDETTGSGYLLHASRAFWPVTGEERYVDRPTGIVWRLEPGQTLVVKTRERVRMPADIAGTCSALRRLTELGVAMLDAGVVEPLYDGPLGVTLVNLSRQTVLISPLDPVARLSLQRLSEPPAWPRPVALDDDTYDTRLAKSAARRPASLAALGPGVEPHAGRGERVARFAIPAAVALVIALAAEPFVARAVTSSQPTYATAGDVAAARERIDRQEQQIATLRSHLAYDDGVIARLMKHRNRR